MKSKLFLSLSLLAAVSFVESAAEAAKPAAEAVAVAATAGAESVKPGMIARTRAFVSSSASTVAAKLPTAKVAGQYAVGAAVVSGLVYAANEQYKAYNKPEVKPLTYTEKAKEAFNNAYVAIKSNPIKSATAAVVAAAVIAAVYNSFDSEVSAA